MNDVKVPLTHDPGNVKQILQFKVKPFVLLQMIFRINLFQSPLLLRRIMFLKQQLNWQRLFMEKYTTLLKMDRLQLKKRKCLLVWQLMMFQMNGRQWLNPILKLKKLQKSHMPLLQSFINQYFILLTVALHFIRGLQVILDLTNVLASMRRS